MNQGDIGGVDAGEVHEISEEVREQSQKIWLYDRLTLFNKFAIATIWARSMIAGDLRDHLVIVLLSEIISQEV